jgi:hypothetical protein
MRLRMKPTVVNAMMVPIAATILLGFAMTDPQGRRC